MSNTNKVAVHYTHGNLLKAIEFALNQLGQTLDSVTLEQLSLVDEFHIVAKKQPSTC